jgi:hypothetical protein
MKEPRKAAEITIGRCGHGVCIDMKDRQGNVICHAHGFDAIAFMGKLRELIVQDAVATSAGCA